MLLLVLYAITCEQMLNNSVISGSIQSSQVLLLFWWDGFLNGQESCFEYSCNYILWFLLYWWCFNFTLDAAYLISTCNFCWSIQHTVKKQIPTFFHVNAAVAGLPAHIAKTLQILQNPAACQVFNQPEKDHFTPLFLKLLLFIHSPLLLTLHLSLIITARQEISIHTLLLHCPLVEEQFSKLILICRIPLYFWK